jgi:hypothetical protein
MSGLGLQAMEPEEQTTNLFEQKGLIEAMEPSEQRDALIKGFQRLELFTINVTEPLNRSYPSEFTNLPVQIGTTTNEFATNLVQFDPTKKASEDSLKKSFDALEKELAECACYHYDYALCYERGYAELRYEKKYVHPEYGCAAEFFLESALAFRNSLEF